MASQGSANAQGRQSSTAVKENANKAFIWLTGVMWQVYRPLLSGKFSTSTHGWLHVSIIFWSSLNRRLLFSEKYLGCNWLAAVHTCRHGHQAASSSSEFQCVLCCLQVQLRL